MKIIETSCAFDVSKQADSRRACCCTSFRRSGWGTILASFRLGSTKDSLDGNCVVVESCDDGKTWNVITAAFDRIVDGTDGEIRVCELAETGGYALQAFLLWVDRSSGKALYDGQTDSVLPTKLIMTRSEDRGRTWEPHVALETDSLGGPALSGPTVNIPDQGLLVPFENFQPDEGTHTANALLAKDGKSFDTVLQVARDPSDRLYFFDERHAWCSKTGRGVAMFWSYDRQAEKDVDIHISWTDPETLTWQAPQPIGIKGQVAQPIPLPDGRLLAFYVHRHPPGSLRLVISSDGGKTWAHDEELIVHECDNVKQKGLDGESDYAQYWDDMLTNWNFGHPTGVVLDDDTVLLGYYAGPDAEHLSVWSARVEL